jgi:hypothetical protein
MSDATDPRRNPTQAANPGEDWDEWEEEEDDFDDDWDEEDDDWDEETWD